jgi:DNA-binding MarR family transcriptional regulator
MKPLTLIPALHRATHQIGLYLERAGEVTQAEAHILAHLAEHGARTVAELHTALAHRRSTLTSILDRLEGRGLATREVSPSDRRSFVITLTPEGATVAARVHALLQALEARALATDEDTTAAGVLEALQRAAEEGFVEP